jgi:hypothetical protein
VAGGRSDDYSVRVIDDDFDSIPFVLPLDCGLMGTPRAQRKYDKTEDRRKRRFHSSDHTARIYARVKNHVATDKMRNTTTTTAIRVVRLDFVAGRSDSNISSPQADNAGIHNIRFLHVQGA